MKKRTFLLIIILIAISACHVEHDSESWPRYQVSMKYDYGDTVFTSFGSCDKPITNIHSSEGGYIKDYFYFVTWRSFCKFIIQPYNNDNSDIYLYGCFTKEHFEYNHKYYQDSIPYNGISTRYFSRDGSIKPKVYGEELINFWYQFLPPNKNNLDLAFSLQFGGECLDEGSLPDSIMVNVTGQIDIYNKYFKTKEYTSRHGDYTEFIQ